MDTFRKPLRLDSARTRLLPFRTPNIRIGKTPDKNIAVQTEKLT